MSQGISLSALKNACKALGLGRWPYVRRKQHVARSKETLSNQPPHAGMTSSDHQGSEMVLPCSGAGVQEVSAELGQEGATEEEDMWRIEVEWVDWFMGMGLDEDGV